MDRFTESNELGVPRRMCLTYFSLCMEYSKHFVIALGYIMSVWVMINKPLTGKFFLYKKVQTQKKTNQT